MLSLISAKLSQIKKDSCQYCPKPHFSRAFPNFWRAVYILDGLKVSKLTANFQFWVNYLFKWFSLQGNISLAPNWTYIKMCHTFVPQTGTSAVNIQYLDAMAWYQYPATTKLSLAIILIKQSVVCCYVPTNAKIKPTPETLMMSL